MELKNSKKKKKGHPELQQTDTEREGDIRALSACIWKEAALPSCF